MNYTSWVFWLLFALVLLPYWLLRRRAQNMLLLVASYVFYGFWDYRFLFLILISTVIDFIGGLGVVGIRLSAARLARLGLLLIFSALALCTPIDYRALAAALLSGNGQQACAALPHQLSDYWITLLVAALVATYTCLLPYLYALSQDARRKTFLTISMVANLAILGFFKYCDFFIASMGSALQSLGFEASLATLDIILPAGISFYTFQAMSYTIDLYRGDAAPTDNFADFALFVCFFPHLVAGPIMRAHTLLPQVTQDRHLAPGAVEEGLYLVLIGLFKKMVVADNLANLANIVFDRYAAGADTSGPEVLVGTYAFAFQIYGDFSGYSSIARGISRWLGFELVINFDNPYLAVSPSDFWRRWHISLSTWLRDYLYFALGGNRLGNVIMYRNLMMTMFLGGLWHGANWTFVAWGLYHGFILCVFRLLPLRDPPRSAPLRWLGRVVLMFHLTCIGWLFFRAATIGAALGMVASLCTDWRITPLVPTGVALLAFYAGPMFFWEASMEGERRLDQIHQQSWTRQALQLAYLLMMFLLFTAAESQEFIYFQF
jgi:alginate O-acetyltransferase complex protein AlgI